ETLDKHQVAFVSITQQFSTGTSMGRLVLNVLLSFAQFEREIIAERTRDKIAATRRKGKWTGGTPILGYDVDPQANRLQVNADEAERVRAIFELYLEQQALVPVVEELERRRWANKRWVTKAGHERGGLRFTKTNLHRLLTNVCYAGRVRYKTEVHAGEQPAIVDTETFQRVQALLRRQGPGSGRARTRGSALLQGVLRCVPCGSAVTPAHTKRGNARYRYYTCTNAQKRGWKACPSRSIPAAEMDKVVLAQIRGACPHSAENEGEQMLDGPGRFDHWWQALSPQGQGEALLELVEKVDYDGRAGQLAITFRPGGFEALAEAPVEAAIGP